MYERYRIERHNTISELYFIKDIYFNRVIASGLSKDQMEQWTPSIVGDNYNYQKSSLPPPHHEL